MPARLSDPWEGHWRAESASDARQPLRSVQFFVWVLRPVRMRARSHLRSGTSQRPPTSAKRRIPDFYRHFCREQTGNRLSRDYQRRQLMSRCAAPPRRLHFHAVGRVLTKSAPGGSTRCPGASVSRYRLAIVASKIVASANANAAPMQIRCRRQMANTRTAADAPRFRYQIAQVGIGQGPCHCLVWPMQQPGVR